MDKNTNGNQQLNDTREELNQRTNKKLFLGNTKRVSWNGLRRHRSI